MKISEQFPLVIRKKWLSKFSEIIIRLQKERQKTKN